MVNLKLHCKSYIWFFFSPFSPGDLPSPGKVLHPMSVAQQDVDLPLVGIQGLPKVQRTVNQTFTESWFNPLPVSAWCNRNIQQMTFWAAPSVIKQ